MLAFIGLGDRPACIRDDADAFRILPVYVMLASHLEVLEDTIESRLVAVAIAPQIILIGFTEGGAVVRSDACRNAA